MKEIKAFVKPFKVNDIVHQLIDAGFPNITISMAEGTGNFQGEDPGISTHFSISDSPIAKLELVCKDLDEAKIVAIISEHGKTGNSGDGLIYVSNVEQVYRVKTGVIAE